LLPHLFLRIEHYISVEYLNADMTTTTYDGWYMT
jgi:hypothetical protein